MATLLHLKSFVNRFLAPILLVALTIGQAFGQAHPYRGLWVGQAELNAVNEVTVSLDENNNPAPTPPQTTTPAAGKINFRLILHVNGAGQVSLLKDVAILNHKNPGANPGGDGATVVNLVTNGGNTSIAVPELGAESDLALVTDERLYPDFPPQATVRIASAMFDFGDSRATDAVNTIIEIAAQEASKSVSANTTADFTTAAGRFAASSAAAGEAEPFAQAVIDIADVEERFQQFLGAEMSPSFLESMVAAATDAAGVDSELAAATAAAAELMEDPVSALGFDGSASDLPAFTTFYQDPRGEQIVQAVGDAVKAVLAANPSATQEEKNEAAQNAAASVADPLNTYQRFIASQLFGDMIAEAAGAAGDETAELTKNIIDDFQEDAGDPEITIISAVAHGLLDDTRIVISGAGLAAYNGEHPVTTIDDDSFSVPVAYVGPQGIDDYTESALGNVTLSSVDHGLVDGARVVISGADTAAYNGEHEIAVIDSGSFTIPVAFVDNPANKGTWEAVDAGVWVVSETIHDAVNAAAKVIEAKSEALTLKTSATRYEDSRAENAIAVVLEDLILAAASSESTDADVIAAEASAAALEALETKVARFPLVTAAPTLDYLEFIESDDFLESAALAARAAAEGAVTERSTNGLYTDLTLFNEAKTTAFLALQSTLSKAALVVRSELPMTGSFGPGQSGLTGTINLAANHPTNPFRHRRHPDHGSGFAITRVISMDFDGAPGDPLAPAGYGVDRITGTFGEEIFGLHKPLGQNQDIGLRVRGGFELQRISLIDTLNAQ